MEGESPEVRLARIDERVSAIAEDVTTIKGHLEDRFVSKEAFMPVQRIVYGAVWIVLVGVLSGILVLVVKQAP